MEIGRIMRYRNLEEVRVRQAAGVGRLFVSKERRQAMGQVGKVISYEIGRYSKQPIYTVLLSNNRIACLLENELESVK